MTQLLEGLELRKAALEAAGWKCQQKDWDGLKTYGVVDPDGVTFGSMHYATPKQAWQHAPAVELSVDTALEYLPLNDTDYWKLIGPCDGSYYVHIATETETTWISIAGRVDRQSFARAMCRAYLEYKANR